MPASELETTFAYWWDQLAKPLGCPDLVTEAKLIEGRRFRVDFAALDAKVCVELEGGTWSGGRHTRGKGYESDCEKYNLLTAKGYRVFRFTSGMLDRDPEGAIKLVAEAVLGLKAS